MREEWIAYRLAVLCANGQGIVHGGSTVRDHGVRAALLLDLAMRDRLSSGGDRTYLDTRPSGFPPADAVLRYVDTHPAHSVGRLLSSAPITVLDVLGAEVERGRFRGRRSARVDRGASERERRLVGTVAETGRTDSPATAALTVIAGALDLTTTDQRAALLAWCGSTRSLVAECADYLDRLMMKMTAVAQVRGSASE